MSRRSGDVAGTRAAGPVGFVVLLVTIAVLAQVGIVTATTSVAGEAGSAIQSNNTTVRHEDPERVREQSSEAELRRWLSQRIVEQLQRSSVNLSQGQYNQAREALDDEYRYTEKYAEVTGETADGGAASDETVTQVTEFSQTQQRIAGLAAKYNRTYRSYQTARANGNATGARRLARRGDRLTNQIRENRTRLVRLERNTSQALGRDLTAIVTSVNETVDDITARQAQIRQREFVGTRLDVSANASTTAIGRPVALAGQLRTVAGEPVANRNISIQIGKRTLRTRTDGAGRFETVYEPTATLGLSTNLTARYQPTAGTAYLYSESPVDVTVRQRTPRVVVDVTSSRVGYRDTVRVTGNVSVDGAGVGSVPLVVTAGGERLGTVRTTADGSFQFTSPLPAGVRSGEQEVLVRVQQADRALAVSSAAASLLVRPTPTSISVHTTRLDSASERVQVWGRLTTTAGDPIPGQPVRIRVDGEEVEAVRTNSSGWYSTVVSTSGRNDPGTRLVAVYAGANTNLESTNASTTLGGGLVFDLRNALPPQVQQVVDRHPVLTGIFVLLSLANLLLWGVVLWKRSDRATVPASEGERSDTVTSPSPPVSESREHVQDALAAAQRQLSAGEPDRAVIAAYAGIRRQLASTPRDSRTHWEFYRDHHDNGLTSKQVAALRELTEEYERVAYAGDTISTRECERLLATAEETHWTDAGSDLVAGN